MTNWIRTQDSSGCPEELGPLQLAWLGDAIWEMHQRLRHCNKPARPRDLHSSVVDEVKAVAQAKAFEFLKPHLSFKEAELARRGRNKSGKGPKNVDGATYGKATGFETIVGWLFLKDPVRLANLFDLLDDPENHLN